jgi:soluble lytic murein transglycosylase-like protein
MANSLKGEDAKLLVYGRIRLRQQGCRNNISIGAMIPPSAGSIAPSVFLSFPLVSPVGRKAYANRPISKAKGNTMDDAYPARMTPSQSGRAKTASNIAFAVAAAAWLAGCSGMHTLKSAAMTEPAAEAPAQAARPMTPDEEREYNRISLALRAAVNAKPARRQITPRDILREWSTLAHERPSRAQRPGRKKPAETGTLAAAPQANRLTIGELMANQDCDACEALPYHAQVISAARTHGVPPALIHAVIQIESSYNPQATSKMKARGLMQVMPATARSLGIRDSRSLYDPKVNINAGSAYLQYLMRLHDTVDEVLAAYNAGTGNVRKYGGVPPFQETRNYVRNVKNVLKGMACGDPQRCSGTVHVALE